MEHVDSRLDIVASPMDSGTSPSPISLLDQDIMWRIFSMNANMNSDNEFRVYSNDKLKKKNNRALYTTWHSSQVCRFWRRFLLNAPTLWAQLIDLDGFSSVDELMKQEVVRRSGLCPLFIAGHVFVKFPKERDFFISVLRNNWARIGRLRVAISQSNEIPSDVWDILSEPTQTLEYFRIRAFNGIKHTSKDSPITNVFANCSPSLKSFTSWKINFNFGSGDGLNWLSNIRQLNISYMTSMSLPQWLEALQHMPLLEDLQLIHPFPSVAPSLHDKLNVPTIQLPNLLNIYINHTLNSCIVLLDRILPGSGCYLFMDTFDEAHEPPPQSTIIFATQVLSRYSQNFFANNHPTTFQYTITHTAITMAEYHSESPVYRIFVCCGDPAQLPLLFTLLEAYTSCDFSHVETLHFDIDIFPSQTVNFDVLKVLFKFDSAKSLIFSGLGTIPALYKLIQKYSDTIKPSETAIVSLLPYLTTIKATGSSYQFYDEDSPELLLLQETLAKFVTWRIGVKAPVEVVDISDLGAAAKVEIFNGISGLKIVTRTLL